ncbi:MAG: hypothetical protein QW727_01105 [Candidatus Pacearchaeota archaeon]
MMKKIKFFSITGILTLLSLIVLFSNSALAIKDLLALQGNVQQSGLNLASGNLTIYIFDSLSGGNLIWNSTNDPKENFIISNGKYDVLIGKNSTNELSLEYGRLYYLEMYVNNEQLTFNGSNRQVFQSSVGKINGTFVNQRQINSSHLTLNIDLGNATNIQASAVNKTTGTSFLGQMLDEIIDFMSSRLSPWKVSSTSIYNDTENIRVGIGIASPSSTIHVNGSGIFGENNKSMFLDVGDVLLNKLYFDNLSFIFSSEGSLTFGDDSIPSITLSQLASTGGGCSVSNSLLSGGNVVWSGNGLSFFISPATYCIGGLLYETTSTTNVTLPAADTGNDRFDIIVLNISSTTSFVQGTAGENPQVPSADPSTQLKLVEVLIKANATTPGNQSNGPTVEVIYDENTEWTSSQNTPNGEINFDAISNPKNGTKHMDTTTPLRANDIFQFTRATSFNPSLLTSPQLSLWIKVETAWNHNNDRLILAFRNTGGSVVGSSVTIRNGAYGFNRTSTSNYQLIIIPLSDFGTIGTDIKALRVSTAAQGSNSLDFLMDEIKIVGISEGGAGIGLKHSDLTDMPSSTNADHDGRYACRFCVGERLSGRWIFNSSSGTPLSITKHFSGITLNVSDILYVNNANERVGIRTSSPGSNLDVLGNASISTNLSVGNEIFINGNPVSIWLYNQSQYPVNIFDQNLSTQSNVKFNELNVTNILRVGTTLLKADSSGTLNITGETNFNSGWQSGGVTISSGNVLAQALYVVNITSLGVNNLNVNGSINPDILFNNTFDIGSQSSSWRDAYFSREVYVSGKAVSPWLYNQSQYPVNIFDQNLSTQSNVRFSNLTIINGGNITTDIIYAGNYSSKSPISFVNKTNVLMLINESSGFVGIGATNPSHLLTIANSATALNVSGLLYANSTGVGIGATNPSYLLTIANSATALNVSGLLYANSTRVGIGTTNPSHLLTIANSATALNVSGLLYANSTGVGIGTTNPTSLLTVLGNVNITGGVNISGSDIKLGTTSSSTRVVVGDGTLCVGTGGCVAPSVNGRVIIEGTIHVGEDGEANGEAYNSFGDGGLKSRPEISSSIDVYIEGDLEVDGKGFFQGGTEQGDIAETLETKASRNNKICDGDVSCLKKTTGDDLDYGDLVCIDTTSSRLIKKCTQANSQLVVGFISDTAVLTVEPTKVNGYPVSLAGIVNAHVTNENGNIMPGDLLVSSSKPGYAMKNNVPLPGRVVGKAFDFCYKKECTIPVFVTLS